MAIFNERAAAASTGNKQTDIPFKANRRQLAMPAQGKIYNSGFASSVNQNSRTKQFFKR